MALPRETSITPASIQDVRVHLLTHNASNPDPGTVEFEIEVQYSNGETRVRKGNLVPHLTAQQVNQLQSFMASLRTQAETQML